MQNAECRITNAELQMQKQSRKGIYPKGGTEKSALQGIGFKVQTKNRITLNRLIGRFPIKHS